MYACLGDNGVDWDKEWLGIPDAYKVKEVAGQGDGDFVLYKDCLVNISEFDYYDKDYDDYFTYEHDPQGFEAYYIDRANRGELIDQLNSSIRGMVPNISLLKESWLGDKMKAGWEKVKTGAKKFGKAIGDAFNGPFRKGDHIVMKGEDGESFKGTITNWDGSEKTYEVMLGKAVSESFDPEYDGEDEEWIDGVPDLGDAVYFQGSRIPKQDIYMELQDCGVDCYDDAEFDEYCKSNQKKVYGLLSDMCYAYPVNEGL